MPFSPELRCAMAAPLAFGLFQSVLGQTLLWAGQVEGPYMSPVVAMCVDGSGDLWATGFYQGTTDFDLGTGTYLMAGASAEVWSYVAKYSPTGAVLWVGQFGDGAGVDYGTNIEADGNGAIYAAGQFSGTGDFDPGPGTHILDDVDPDAQVSTDVFVVKLDTTSAFDWAIQLGDSASDYCRDMVLDSDGNVILAIHLADTADMDPGPGSDVLNVAYQTAVVVKLDPNGALLWYRDLGPAGGYLWMSLGTDVNDNIWVATNDRIRKFDALGGLLLDLPLAVATKDIDVDASGNVYLIGSFGGTVDMDPGSGVSNTTATGIQDLFCMKLDPLGDLSWAIRLGGTGLTDGWGVELDPNDRVYLTGNYQTALDLDPGPGVWTTTSAGYRDILVVRLDGMGVFHEAMTLSGSGDEIAYDCVSVGPTEWVVHGAFQGTIDADPGAGVVNLTSTTYHDGLIARYASSGSTAIDHVAIDRLQVVPNPSSGVVAVMNMPPGTLRLVVFDAVGAEVMRTAPSIGSTINLDLSDRSDGLYWIKVITPDRIITMPVVLSGQ